MEVIRKQMEMLVNHVMEIIAIIDHVTVVTIVKAVVAVVVAADHVMATEAVILNSKLMSHYDSSLKHLSAPSSFHFIVDSIFLRKTAFDWCSTDQPIRKLTSWLSLRLRTIILHV